MALYAIGDFHLSFSVNKPMEIFGEQWENHVERINENWRNIVQPEDTVVVTGDHSWGRNLEQSQEDLQFIADLPGRKILLRGNHDMFWDAKKTDRLNVLYNGELFFLQNNFFSYRDYALVGTKGYCYEGRGTAEQAQRLINREVERLRVSCEAAHSAGYHKLLMFLHYPPTSIEKKESEFTRMAEYYQVQQVIYSHCHGQARYHDSLSGRIRGIEYRLVSSDYLQFYPLRVLD